MTAPIKIYVDKQEKSEIPKLLEKMGAELEFVTLLCGDYVVSHKYAFEYKSIVDFLESEIGDTKLKVNRQTRDLVASYEKPALLIGGSLLELISSRNIHLNSIMAFLQSIMWSGCAVRFLDTPEITAQYIYSVAEKEQLRKHTYFCPHGKKTKRNLREQQEYIISAIPDVGGKTAVDLLNEFGSVEAVICAPEEELTKIEGIGKTTARHIRAVVGSEYENK